MNPNSELNLKLTIPEINTVLAALEGFTKPLMAKIAQQAQEQVPQDGSPPAV